MFLFIVWYSQSEIRRNSCCLQLQDLCLLPTCKKKVRHDIWSYTSISVSVKSKCILPKIIILFLFATDNFRFGCQFKLSYINVSAWVVDVTKVEAIRWFTCRRMNWYDLFASSYNLLWTSMVMAFFNPHDWKDKSIASFSSLLRLARSLLHFKRSKNE